ncbi:ABC transporter ATP-binding protein [Microbacterium barkeri]|uniref:ABC transporter ATP-binding protein n=1 Tax=Microbacterium barkeri TaxID=33917 RepID=A0A9W6H128_9MICO|nr:ATP-binding cassette domain-containing protein [Microbacterium barkeri]MDR6875282.1 peptide/nickel transport system ATP-binding protein [Microbacterium barkeri]WRH18100.1 ATP-binding cassette domain-containing protein [Microbacterium sp. JZ37]GLJ60555.1 ABC transporter ATP-binding protein [Microbacterium barkeri]
MAVADILLRARALERRHLHPRTTLFERRRETVALHPTDLDIRRGEAVGIIGESGSGKSTLVRLLLGLDVPTAGTVEYDGRPVDARAPARALHGLRRATGIVFQDPYASLDPRMTVARIVEEPLWALGIPGDRAARVREVLAQVGLEPDMADRYPHEFSGGQRQRIALARAIVHRPETLVGDEPLSALDVTVRAQILALLADLRARERMTLVLVSHDIGVVQNLCDTVVVMKDGRVVEHGPTPQVLLFPREDYTRRLLAAIPTIDQPRA